MSSASLRKNFLNKSVYGSTITKKMPKVLFAGGIGQRELLRANTLPSMSRVKIGCFARIGIYEENARFMLLSLILLLYLSFGAALFNYLERDNEIREKSRVNAYHLRHQSFAKNQS
uniref:Uncharacterized protein n=1 Tax=Ascaris lumbricoides TaxID=6252 RepID=A0A0M3ICW5_ASCLU